MELWNGVVQPLVNTGFVAFHFPFLIFFKNGIRERKNGTVTIFSLLRSSFFSKKEREVSRKLIH